MNLITFNCRVTTPMFSGDAFQNAEIRPTEIKAAIRFWWRAVNHDKDTKSLYKNESKIFGTGGEDSVKSIFSISTTQHDFCLEPLMKKTLRDKLGGTDRDIDILLYLGFGPISPKQALTKSYIKPGSEFKVSFNFQSGTDSHIVDSICQSFVDISLFGGIGGRSRNGFGKFCIIDSERKELCYDIEKRFKQLISGSPKDYTAFSEKSILYKLRATQGSWEATLFELGKIYRSGRSGNKYFNESGIDSRHNVALRQYIAAPVETNSGSQQDIRKSFLDRHAKSLFLNVTEQSDKKYNGYILFLPYNYLQNKPHEIQFNRNVSNTGTNYQNAYNALNDIFSSKLDQIK